MRMSVDSLAVATVGMGGHVFNEIRVARPRGHFRPGQTVVDISQLAGPLLAALPSDHNLVGLGVAIVGITRRSDGFVHFAPNLGWRDVPLAEMLADELRVDVPVRVANDARANPSGRFVLYWMTAHRRLEWNFALDRALELGRRLSKPLVILEGLRADYPWATARTFKTRIRRNIRLAEAPSFGQSIFDYAPSCNGAEDYRLLAKELVRMPKPAQLFATTH